MTGFWTVNLLTVIDELGEDFAKKILSEFSCPMNPDVESFLHTKAIDFARQGWAQTHLVFTSYKGVPVLVGYYALANKYIRITAKIFHKGSSTLRKRVAKFASYDKDLKAYIFSAPLIAQLGKNYCNGYDKLLQGYELLAVACKKIKGIQFDLGGRFAYIECEDKEKLTDFYKRNGFIRFDERTLDADECEKLSGKYLVQMIKYIR